jgi:hypothetical protein
VLLVALALTLVLEVAVDTEMLVVKERYQVKKLAVWEHTVFLPAYLVLLLTMVLVAVVLVMLLDLTVVLVLMNLLLVVMQLLTLEVVEAVLITGLLLVGVAVAAV